MVLWDSINDNPPEELKVSPIAMIPQKYQLFRATLDLSFAPRLKNGELLPSVNESYVKTAPQGGIEKLRHSLIRMIHVFTQVDGDMNIFMATWDIKG